MSEDTKTSINTCYGLENIKIYIGAACSICITYAIIIIFL